MNCPFDGFECNNTGCGIHGQHCVRRRQPIDAATVERCIEELQELVMIAGPTSPRGVAYAIFVERIRDLAKNAAATQECSTAGVRPDKGDAGSSPARPAPAAAPDIRKPDGEQHDT